MVVFIGNRAGIVTIARSNHAEGKWIEPLPMRQGNPTSQGVSRIGALHGFQSSLLTGYGTGNFECGKFIKA